MTTADNARQAILTLRYGEQTKPSHLLWNDQIAALLQHRSVRDYLPDALPAGALESMVAAAQSASTSSNLHQWSVVAVTEPALKAQIADLASGKKKDANGFIKQAPAWRISPETIASPVQPVPTPRCTITWMPS